MPGESSSTSTPWRSRSAPTTSSPRFGRTSLLLTDDQQRETTIAMPEDEFYVSFAPYVSQTHDCHFHSLTTCVGELQNADVQVTVTDEASGETLVDEALTTYDNGFLGVWLPRDIDGTLTVEYEGLTAEWPITTKGGGRGNLRHHPSSHLIS
ncbi:MAG: CueP family metal-binding protein [Tessaracoccus sp.]